MAQKATYGYPTATNKQEAQADARARATNQLGFPDIASCEVIETDEHKANGEFVVVVRSS